MKQTESQVPVELVDTRRVTVLKSQRPLSGPVIYWMIRDQRAEDNWALSFAQEAALELQSPLAVVFTLSPTFLEATLRQYTFMLEGLKDVERALLKDNIPFVVLSGSPPKEIVRFIRRNRVATLVSDFSPLRPHRAWQADVAKHIQIPYFEVDAHNIVPSRFASPKQEYAAYTLRPKVHRHLASFLTDFPAGRKHPYAWPEAVPPTDWATAYRSLRVDRSVTPVNRFSPGAKAAKRLLRRFLDKRLPDYHNARNDPTRDAQSHLSPYLHFGHLAPQRVALEAQRRTDDVRSQETFLEELIIRRELSDNFCLHNDAYDAFAGFPGWAQETLNEHRKDPRPHVYSDERFERAETHDELWNSAQMEMLVGGKMHGYMRMYWAKKILEWSPSPQEALRIALYLNDRYELDGCDPNGYAGVAWSIGGVHDRPWFEREIFGKVRYMSHGGCRRKFDVDRYIADVKQHSTEVAR